MNKSFLMRFDKVDAQYESTKINKLSFDVKPESLTVLRCSNKNAVNALILGNIIPLKGYISLAGVTITERNANERRVSAMPSSIVVRDPNKLLHNTILDGLDLPTYYEIKRTAKKEEQAHLRAQLKKSPENREKIKVMIKQTNIDYIAVGLKMQRRKDELELNLKSSKSLLSAIWQGSLDNKEVYAEKMKAKLFSAQYELAMFTHKQISESSVNDRILTVIDKLGLSEQSNDCALAFACAYVKAPELIAYCGSPSADELSEIASLVDKSGTAVVVITDPDYDCTIGNSVSISDRCFEGFS